MIDTFLSSIGLTDKEVRLYLLLLRFGTQPTSSLAKHTKLSRSTAYSSLQRLEQKGLVSEAIVDGVQYFTPLEPSQVAEYLDNQVQDLLQKKEEASVAIEKMQSLRSPLARPPKVQVFVGEDGAKIALRKTLQSKEKTILAFTSLFDLGGRLGEQFIETYTRERVRAKRKIQIIRTKEQYKRALKAKGARPYETDAKELREVRYAPSNLDLSLGMYLYDEMIIVISPKEENYALVIESQALSHLFRGIFKLLWQALG